MYFVIGDDRISFTIHKLCLRIQVSNLLNGKIFNHELIFVVSFILLLLATMIFGPIYCGKLCPTGALTEYLSRLIPERFKIDWIKYADITPIRYGMLAGFMILPLFNIIVVCAYCNFYVFDLLVNYYFKGYIVALTSGLILTSIFWLVILGLFTKGGRGFCNFMCPVGAFQNLIYFWSSKLFKNFRLIVNHDKCVNCKKCINVCPMRAMHFEDNLVKNNIHNCIICGECENVCPMKVIKYQYNGKNNLNFKKIILSICTMIVMVLIGLNMFIINGRAHSHKISMLKGKETTCVVDVSKSGFIKYAFQPNVLSVYLRCKFDDGNNITYDLENMNAQCSPVNKKKTWYIVEEGDLLEKNSKTGYYHMNLDVVIPKEDIYRHNVARGVINFYDNKILHSRLHIEFINSSY